MCLLLLLFFVVEVVEDQFLLLWCDFLDKYRSEFFCSVCNRTWFVVADAVSIRVKFGYYLVPQNYQRTIGRVVIYLISTKIDHLTKIFFAYIYIQRRVAMEPPFITNHRHSFCSGLPWSMCVLIHPSLLLRDIANNCILLF